MVGRTREGRQGTCTSKRRQWETCHWERSCVGRMEGGGDWHDAGLCCCLQPGSAYRPLAAYPCPSLKPFPSAGGAPLVPPHDAGLCCCLQPPGAYRPLAAYPCPSLEPFPSAGGGAHQPLTPSCPPSPCTRTCGDPSSQRTFVCRGVHREGVHRLLDLSLHVEHVLLRPFGAPALRVPGGMGTRWPNAHKSQSALAGHID